MQPTAATRGPRKDRLREALRAVRSSFWAAGGLSLAINVLMLTGPLFMLQVYDRVLASGSVPTLVGLSVLAAGLYLFQAGLDIIRARVLLRVGEHFDGALCGRCEVVVGTLEAAE